MGTWSADMLGSDMALDTLGELGDIIGYNNEEGDSLYPLPSKDTQQHEDIKELLLTNENKILNNKWHDETEAWPVVSCIYMATGTTMSQIIKEKALKACNVEITYIEDYNWKDGGSERIKVLKNYIELLNNYNGEVANIEHEGLFQKMSER